MSILHRCTMLKHTVQSLDPPLPYVGMHPVNLWDVIENLQDTPYNDQIYLNFMQFFGNLDEIVFLCPLLRVGAPCEQS